MSSRELPIKDPSKYYHVTEAQDCAFNFELNTQPGELSMNMACLL